MEVIAFKLEKKKKQNPIQESVTDSKNLGAFSRLEFRKEVSLQDRIGEAYNMTLK